MIAASIPVKFQAVWANAASGSYIRTVPVTTATPGAASLNQGFPALTATPIGSGGIPPDIRDFNGILNPIVAAVQWLQAGAQYPYDATWAATVNGYPRGAVIPSTTLGTWWLNTVDSNTSNPDTGGANWLNLAAVLGPVANVSVAWATGSSTTTSTTFQSAGSTLTLTKKRSSNHVIFLGLTQVQSDTTSSPNGCSAKMQLAQNSSGPFTAFGNSMTTRGESGSAFVFGGAAVSIFGDMGTLGSSYSCQVQWASNDGSFVSLTFSALLAIELWA